MRYLGRRQCSYFGYVATVLFFVFWAAAVYFDGSWTFGGKTLSNLGISDNPISCILFNWCLCIMCALIWMVEVVGIALSETDNGRWYGALASAAMVAYIGIGIFNMDYGHLHTYVAQTYMGITVCSMVVACLSGFYRRKKVFIMLTAAVMVVGGICLLAFSFPLAEAIVITLAVLWSLTVTWAYGTYDGPVRG